MMHASHLCDQGNTLERTDVNDDATFKAEQPVHFHGIDNQCD